MYRSNQQKLGEDVTLDYRMATQTDQDHEHSTIILPNFKNNGCFRTKGQLGFAVHPILFSSLCCSGKTTKCGFPALWCVWMRSCSLPARLKTQPGFHRQPVSHLSFNVGKWPFDLRVHRSSCGTRDPTSNTGCNIVKPNVEREGWVGIQGVWGVVCWSVVFGQ